MKSATGFFIVLFLFPFLSTIYFAMQFCVFPFVLFVDLVRATVQPESIPFAICIYGEEVFTMYLCWTCLFVMVGAQ